MRELHEQTAPSPLPVSLAGADVFLSYSRADADVVLRLQAKLKEAGRATFLDRDRLPAGQEWLPALEQGIARCGAVAVLVGPAGLGTWQRREVHLALDRQAKQEKFPVIPVLLPKVTDPPGGFLRLQTWVDLRQDLDDPGQLQLLLAGIRGEAPADAGAAVREAICPYRGLLAFREEDAGLFFGREDEVADLVAKVRSQPLLTLVGRSGSGKSSVIYAGLIPALRRRADGRSWAVIGLRPGAEPLHAVVRAFDPPPPGLAPLEATERTERQVALFRANPNLLAAHVRGLLAADAEKGTDRLLLYIDQWEELYTQALHHPAADPTQPAADVARFMDLLLEAARSSPCTVVLTVRADFYADLLRHEALAAAVPSGLVNLGPLSRADLARTIRQPASTVGITVDGPLVEELLDRVAEDLAKLPLLEYALKETWQRRRERRLSLDAYGEAGGINGAVAKRASEILARLGEAEQAAARRLFVSLVTPGEGREDTRARVAVPEDKDLTAVIRAFSDAEARLLVTGTDVVLGADTQIARRLVEISHEALIREWEPLRQWIEANRDTLRRRERVREWMAAWEERGHDASLLLPSGLALEVGRKLLEDHGDVLIDDVRAYVEASLTADDERRQQEEKERQQKLSTAQQLVEKSRELAAAEVDKTRVEREKAEQQANATRRMRNRAQVAGAIGLFALLFAVMAGWQWWVAKQQADETTAALIWAQLDFEGIDDPKSTATVTALWALTVSEPAIREAFLRQLARNDYQVSTLALAPALIERAFGVHPKPGDTERLLAPVLTAISQNTDPVQLQALALAAQILGSAPTREQIQPAVEQAIVLIQTTKDPNQLLALMQAIQNFKLNSLQTQKIVQYVLGVIPDVKDTAQSLRLAQTIHNLIPAAYQLQLALDSVIKSISNNIDPYQILKLTQTVQTFKAQSEQLQQCIIHIIEIIKENNNRKELRILTTALKNLTPNPQQAQVVTNHLLSILNEKNTMNQTTDLLQALLIISPISGTSIGKIDYDVIVRLISQTNDDQDQLNSLLDLAANLAGLLTVEDAAQYFNDTLSYMTKVETGHNLWALGNIAELIGQRLSHNFRNNVADDILTDIKRTSHPYQLRALARALHAVVPRADSQQSSEALSQITKISDEKLFSDPWKLQAIILAAEILSCPQNSCPEALSSVEAWANSNLHDLIGILPSPADGGQRQARIETILSLLRMLPPQESRLGGEQLVGVILKSFNPGTLDSLNDVLQEIAITSEQAKTALHAIVQAVATADNPDRFTKLRDCAQILFTKLRSSDQAQAALDDVLEATKLVNHTDGDNQHSMLKILADAVQVLGPTLTAQQKAEAIEAARNQLAQVDSPDIAMGLASAIVANIPFDQTKPELYVVDIISLLKWPTTAGPATEILLEALHKQVPDAPGKRLDATVAWAAKTYPEIDLDSPPTYPAAARTGGGR